MQFEAAEQVEVRITRSAKAETNLDELLRNLEGGGEPQVEEIITTAQMTVELSGSAFEIISHGPAEQAVTRKNPACWQFDVKAKKWGTQYLSLTVGMRVPVDGHEDVHRSVPALQRSVVVEVSIPARIGYGVKKNWVWSVVGAGAAVATAVGTFLAVH